MADKYMIKNKINRQVTIEMCEMTVNDPKPDKVFLLPPLSVRAKLLTQDEYNYVKSRYGKNLIIRKTS